MLNIRSFTLLCAITLCVSIAAVFVIGDSSAIPGSGKPLFPDLMPRLNEIEDVQVESATGRFVLEKTPTGWAVPDKSGYPADADKVHKLLVGAAGLNRVEPKTSNPALYPKLGLADLSDETSEAISYRLDSGPDSTVASLVVGKSAPAKGDPDLSEFYVRLPGDPQIWLVEGKLPSGKALVDWLDRRIASVDRARVREVRVRHASGETVTVSREIPGEDPFQLPGAPVSKTVDGQWKLNDIGRLFSNLELEDVLPVSEARLEAEPDYIVTMRTFDGLELRMEVFRNDDRALALLKAGFQSEQQAADTEVASQPEQKSVLRNADEARDEAAALNARWDGWIYVLPDFKVDAMARTQKELLKDISKEDKPDQG